MKLRAVILACLLAPAPLFEAEGQANIFLWRMCSPVDTQPGDLVFRRDNGVWSWLFVRASTREERFSHAGIVIEGGVNPIIIHADANELTGAGCVRKQSWTDFFSESVDGAVYRYSGCCAQRHKIAIEAKKRLGVPFDTGFDMMNTNKLYCTELVRESVNAATVDNTIGFTQLNSLKRLIAVDDCYKTNMVKIAECCRQ